MIEVVVNEGERIEDAVKRFKRQTLRSGVLKEVRRRQEYVKPSVAKRLKSEAARSRKRSRRAY